MPSPKQSSHYITDFADIPAPQTTEFVEVPVPEFLAPDVEPTPDNTPCVLMRRLDEGACRRFQAKGEMQILANMTDAERKDEIARWRDYYDSGARDRELIKLCYVKPDGRPLFSDEEVRRFQARPDRRAFRRMVTAAEQENLLTFESFEAFRKNVPTPRTAGSIDSPAPSA